LEDETVALPNQSQHVLDKTLEMKSKLKNKFVKIRLRKIRKTH